MADTTVNPITSWLSETLQRLFSKSPAYFKVWNIILAALVIIPQVPSWLAALNITIPPTISPVVAKIITIAAAAGLFISKLTVKDATAIAANTSTDKLAYTASKDLGVGTPPKPAA